MTETGEEPHFVREDMREPRSREERRGWPVQARERKTARGYEGVCAPVV